MMENDEQCGDAANAVAARGAACPSACPQEPAPTQRRKSL